MIYCTKCGKLNTESRKVCEACGQDLTDCPKISTEKMQKIEKRKATAYRRVGLIAGLVWLIMLCTAVTVVTVRGLFFGSVNAVSMLFAGVSLIAMIPWFIDRMIHERMYDWICDWKLWQKRWRDEWSGYEGSANVNERFEHLYRLNLAIAGGIAFFTILLAFVLCFV